MTRLAPQFQRRWRVDEDGVLVPDSSPLPPNFFWWVATYASVEDWTLVGWVFQNLATGDETGGETLYFRDRVVASGGGALDLYQPSEFEETERARRQGPVDGRLARSMISTVWNRVNRTQNAHGCPNPIALALRSPENIRQVRLQLP